MTFVTKVHIAGELTVSTRGPLAHEQRCVRCGALLMTGRGMMMMQEQGGFRPWNFGGYVGEMYKLDNERECIGRVLMDHDASEADEYPCDRSGGLTSIPARPFLKPR